MTAKTIAMSHAEASQALVLACRDMLNDQAGQLTADAVTEAVHVAVAEFGDASPAAVRGSICYLFRFLAALNEALPSAPAAAILDGKADTEGGAE